MLNLAGSLEARIELCRTILHDNHFSREKRRRKNAYKVGLIDGAYTNNYNMALVNCFSML